MASIIWICSVEKCLILFHFMSDLIHFISSYIWFHFMSWNWEICVLKVIELLQYFLTKKRRRFEYVPWKIIWFCFVYLISARNSHPEVFCKKVLLKILQYSQENTCVRVSFLIKLQPAPAALLKKRLWQRRFSVNFAKFLRTPFFTEHLRWLLL